MSLCCFLAKRSGITSRIVEFWLALCHRHIAMMTLGLKLFAAITLLEAAGLAQSIDELEALKVPRSIALSHDVSRLWYRWEFLGNWHGTEFAAKTY